MLVVLSMRENNYKQNQNKHEQNNNKKSSLNPNHSYQYY